MKLLIQLPFWSKNKYLLTFIGFTVWLLFFDARDVFTNLQRGRELERLERSRDYYLQQIETTKKELQQLKNDPVTLEKYAREKYRMKRDNEDLFILTE